MKKFLLAALLVASQTVTASVQIGKSDFFAPSRLGNVELYHSDKGFTVLKDGEKHRVHSYDVDKTVRNLSSEQLNSFLGKDITYLTQEEVDKLDLVEVTLTEEQEAAIMAQFSSGYLVLNQLSNGDYTVAAKVRLPGGGIWGSICGAWAGKLLVHGIAHGAIFFIGGCVGVATCNPYAAGAVIATLEKCVIPAIEATSVAVALAGGIAGGVATGPI